jgi:hypothetical protein
MFPFSERHCLDFAHNPESKNRIYKAGKFKKLCNSNPKGEVWASSASS